MIKRNTIWKNALNHSDIHAYRYMKGGNVGSQLSLPYSDEIGKVALKRIFANTEREKIKRASPL